MGKVIVVDANKCYACLGCVVECAYRRAGADESAPLTSAIFSQAACDVVAVGIEPVPLVCNHCEDAPCLQVCPTRAIRRDSEEGPVLLDGELCIGCKACILACPFGMIRLRKTGAGGGAIKCDLCSDRLAEGLLPSCVTACPSGALTLKELDEVVAAAKKRAGAELLSGRKK